MVASQRKRTNKRKKVNSFVEKPKESDSTVFSLNIPEQDPVDRDGQEMLPSDTESSSPENPRIHMADSSQKRRLKRRKRTLQQNEEESSSSSSEQEVEGFKQKAQRLGLEVKPKVDTLLPLKREWKLKGELEQGDIRKKISNTVQDLEGMVDILGDDYEKEKDEEEKNLEEIVFGGFGATSRFMADDRGEDDKEDDSDDEGTREEKGPAWVDEDDQEISVNDISTSHKSLDSSKKYCDYQKEKFISSLGAPSWAKLKKRKEDYDSSDEEDEVLKRVGDVTTEGQDLPSHLLKAKLCKPLNFSTDNEGAILTCAEFHPKSQVALIGGSSGTASIVQVNGKENPKIQTISFKNFGIQCGHFSRDGEEFFLSSGHHRHFFAYDMIKGKVQQVNLHRKKHDQMLKKFFVSPDERTVVFLGKWGQLHVLSAKTKEWIDTLQLSSTVTGVAFSPGGEKMFAHTDVGEVFVYDMNARSCIHKFVDDGCVQGTAVAASPNGQFLACGSNSGVVNVYNSSDLYTKSHPSPLKILLNLVTPVTSLSFNSTSEILAMASADKNNALRLVHFPSLNAFRNFPDPVHRVRRPCCLDFSLNSGYMSIGTNVGKALLYRLQHYRSF